MRRRAVAGAVLLALAVVAGGAEAQSRQACIEAHESSQVLRRSGKLRAAREQLVVCRQDSCPDILRASCTQWLEQVDASMPSIVVEGRDPSGAATADVRVTIDGAPVTEHLDGRAVPIDPGAHRMRFEAAGRVRELPIMVAEGQKNQLVVADFRDERHIEPPAAAVDTTEVERLAAQRSRRTVGLLVGGVGAAALAGGAVFGALALHAASDAKCTPACPPTDATGATNPKLVAARDAYDRAKAFALASDVGLLAGVALLGIGAYLVLANVPRPAPLHRWVTAAPVLRGGVVTIGGAL